jgi:hypothetical protein
MSEENGTPTNYNPDSVISMKSHSNVVIVASGDINNQGVIGQFSGDVANVINEIPTSEAPAVETPVEQPSASLAQPTDSTGFKALMSQLQNRVKKNEQLSPAEKSSALDQMQALAAMEQVKHQPIMLTTTTDDLLSDEP